MNEFDSKFYMTIGKKMRELRILRKMTLADLALKLNVTIKTIQRYEMGERKIDEKKLKDITDALSIPYDEFVDEVQREAFPNVSLPESPTKVLAKILTKDEQMLIQYFRILNDIGQKKVLDNVSDLTLIKAYQKKTIISDVEN